METTSRSKQQFCRCGHARSFTLQGLRHICRDPKCECVKHDTAVTPPKAKLGLVETPAPDTTLPIDGNVLDRVLLAGAFERQNKAIETATQHLKMGLATSGPAAAWHFQFALAALGDLGAS